MNHIENQVKKLSSQVRWLSILQLIQFLTIAILLVYLYFDNSNSSKNHFSRNSAMAKGISGKALKELIDSNQFVGQSNAKLNMIVFSGFECFHCQNFFDSIYPSIYNNYIKTGIVKFTTVPFVKKNNKLTLYKAKILTCAGFQNKKEQMHQLLMKTQGEIPTEKLQEILNKLDINSSQFNSDMTSPRVEKIIKFNADFISEYEISGTPFFIINGQFAPGNRPYDGFKKIIDNEIKILEDLSQRHTSKSCE